MLGPSSDQTVLVLHFESKHKASASFNYIFDQCRSFRTVNSIQYSASLGSSSFYPAFVVSSRLKSFFF